MKHNEKPRTLARRSRKVVVGLIVGALAGVGGLALAAYLTRAGVTGSVKAGQFAAEWSGAVSLAPTNASNFCGAVSVNASKQLVITPGTGAYPGDRCVIDGQVRLSAGATDEGQIVGLSTSLPTGFKASITQGCGAKVVTYASVPVQVTLEMLPTGVLDGATYNLSAATDGVSVSPFNAAFSGTC